jgi:hypothetical protein
MDGCMATMAFWAEEDTPEFSSWEYLVTHQKKEAFDIPVALVLVTHTRENEP